MHLGVNFQKVGVEGRMIENLCGEDDGVRGGGIDFREWGRVGLKYL